MNFMSLVTVLNVTLTLSGREIFSHIGFQVEPSDRIGLVGPNGSGKTTLLRMLKGEISPDQGEVRVVKGLRTGYLPQDVQESQSGALLESVLFSVPDRLELHKERLRVETLLERVHDKADQEKLAETLAEIHQRLATLELTYPRHEAEKILEGLGFQESDFARPVQTLSGGWKTRAALAALLYQKPDLLLLDEPTNHLDVPSVRWLESFLKDRKGAIVMVSHDREFLNRQVERIISFEPEGMRFYNGNYDFYVKAREEERKILAARARNQEQKVKEAEKFIDRFRAKASKARQAQSKIKLVRKMELVETHRTEKTIHFSFPPVPRSGREVLAIRGMSKGFEEKRLYTDLNLTVLRAERIGVIGPNGCGKTTLLKMTAGEMAPDRGTISLGHGVKLGYFAQHHSEVLNPRNTVVQEVHQRVPQASIGFVRNVCGAFLFSGEDVDKVVGVLSGGERVRVSLAKLLVDPGNFLVMDEPTNHLDIASSEILIDALEKYDGTLLFVSHNQSFVNRLATRIWEIRPNGVVQYPGNLAEYYDHLARIAPDPEAPASEAPASPVKTGHGTGAGRRNRKAEKRERAEKRRRVQDTLKPILADLEKVEARIARLEERQKDLEKSLADAEIFRDKNKSVPLLGQYDETREELERLLVTWEKRHGDLETAKKRLGLEA